MPCAIALRLGGRQRLRRQPLLERPARQPLERHERPGLVLAVVVDAHHVLVRQRGDGLRLAPEPPEVGGRREDLQRDGPVERARRARARPPTSARGPAAPRAGSGRRPRLRVSRHTVLPDSGVATHPRGGAGAGARARRARCRPSTCRRRRRRDASLRRTCAPASTSRRSPARRWTASPCALADLPGTLRIVGESAAGRPFAGAVEPGGAVAISTGAVVPEGADAVVPIEYVVKKDNRVRARRGPSPGAHIRPPRRRHRCGRSRRPARARGSRPAAWPPPRPPASPSCRVARRPRVAVLATGSELVAPGRAARVRARSTRRTRSCSPSALAAAGAEVVAQPPVARRRGGVAGRARAGPRGRRPRHVGRRLGRRARPRPRGRARARRRGGVLARRRSSRASRSRSACAARRSSSACPGIPSRRSSGCELFVKPALRALQGIADPLPRFEPGRLAAGLRRNAERDEFVRARSRTDGDALVLEPLAGQESHMIVALGRRRRARPHSTWKRRARRPARRCAGCAVWLLVDRAACLGRARRRRCARTSVRISSRIGPRRGRSSGLGIRRVAVRRERGQLASRRRARRARSGTAAAARSRRRRAHDVPRRVPAEPVVGGERPDEVARHRARPAGRRPRAHGRGRGSAPAAARARRGATGGRR